MIDKRKRASGEESKVDMKRKAKLRNGKQSRWMRITGSGKKKKGTGKKRNRMRDDFDNQTRQINQPVS